jgi:hypothetical protein
MTSLIEWRNTPDYEVQANLVVKRISAEIGILFLTTTALIETVVYSVFSLLSLPLTSIYDQPYKFFEKRLESSSFTVIWGLFDAVVYNPFFEILETEEFRAREFAQEINPTSIVFFRREDEQIREAFEHSLQPDGCQQLIHAGAQFLQQDVFAGASSREIDLIKECDSDAFMFYSRRAVFIYIAGAKKSEEVPDFFNPKSKEMILKLRDGWKSRDGRKSTQITVTIEEFFQDSANNIKIDKVDEKFPCETTRKVFFQLCGAAIEALQGSILFTKSWFEVTKDQR